MKGFVPSSAERANGIQDNTGHSSRMPNPETRKHSQSAVTINATDPEKLRNVNDKLKTQILTLSDQMGAVIQNLKRKKLENLRQFSQSQPSDPIKEKDRKLRTMQVKITQYKNDITKIKTTLDSVYNYDRIIELEDSIKHKIKEKNKLETEVSGMGRVKIEQERALNSLDSKDSEKQKRDDLHQELVQSKQKVSQLQKETRLEEKRRKEQHSKLINLEERVRLMEKLMKKKESHHHTQSSKSPLTPTSEGVIHTDRLTNQQIEEEIKQIEEEKIIKEKFYKSEIAKINQELVDMGHQSQKLELIMKERDQEARLGQLKLRELRRKIPGKKVRPIISKSVTRPKLVNQKALKKTPSLLMSNKNIIGQQKSPLELLNPSVKSLSHDPLKLAKIKPEALRKVEPYERHEIKMEEQRQEIINGLNDDYGNDDFEELEKLTTQNKHSKTRPSIMQEVDSGIRSQEEINEDINMYQRERGSVATNQPEESMIDNLSVEEIIGEKMVVKPEGYVKGIYSKPLMKKAA